MECHKTGTKIFSCHNKPFVLMLSYQKNAWQGVDSGSRQVDSDPVSDPRCPGFSHRRLGPIFACHDSLM